MKMPYLGVWFWRERFFDLNVNQVARFESIVLKEIVANQPLMKQLESKLGDIQKIRGVEGE